MLCEHYGQVIANIGDRHCDNIQTTSYERCGKVALNVGDNIQTKIYECCVNIAYQHAAHNLPLLVSNIVPMPLPNVGHIETTCRQCCKNIVALSLPNKGDQRWYTIEGTMYECCGNIVVMLSTCCTNIVVTLLNVVI